MNFENWDTKKVLFVTMLVTTVWLSPYFFAYHGYLNKFTAWALSIPLAPFVAMMIIWLILKLVNIFISDREDKSGMPPHGYKRKYPLVSSKSPLPDVMKKGRHW